VNNVATKVKAKTRKAVAARFKISGTGKVMHWGAGKSHILTKKSRKRKNRLAKARELASGLAATYKKMIRGM
jgi:large subunit ribosomal protein L35